MTTIDRNTFKALQDTAGADFVVELVDAFFEEAPVMLEAMRSALAEGDAEKFRRAAHSLKSNSLTFGATQLGAIAKDLELSGLAQVKARPEPLAAVNAEYARVVADLREMCR
jgi:HPt (histidine-containing phosphotransfer) domain-containing protein